MFGVYLFISNNIYIKRICLKENKLIYQKNRKILDKRSELIFKCKHLNKRISNYTEKIILDIYVYYKLVLFIVFLFIGKGQGRGSFVILTSFYF